MAVTVVGLSDPDSTSIINAVYENFKRTDWRWIVVGDNYAQVSQATEAISGDEFWSNSPRKV